MKCDLISKTEDRLVDMIITYVRSNGDYDDNGADLSKVLPMLQASCCTADQLMEVLEALEEDQIIRSRLDRFFVLPALGFALSQNKLVRQQTR